MIILALDTTTRAGSVALVVDGVVAGEGSGDAARTHAERLPGDIIALLEAHRMTAGAIDLFAVASGPGLFTGLRVGIAAMQGLALVGGRPMVGVPALLALAHVAARDRTGGPQVAAWMDAYRSDVFASVYEVLGTGAAFAPERLLELEGATVGDPETTLERWTARGWRPEVMIGDGASRYANVIARLAPEARVAPQPPLAGAIGLIALERARRGDVVPPAGLQPLYVRRPDAELAREHALADRAPDLARPD